MHSYNQNTVWIIIVSLQHYEYLNSSEINLKKQKQNEYAYKRKTFQHKGYILAQFFVCRSDFVNMSFWQHSSSLHVQPVCDNPSSHTTYLTFQNMAPFAMLREAVSINLTLPIGALWISTSIKITVAGKMVSVVLSSSLFAPKQTHQHADLSLIQLSKWLYSSLIIVLKRQD